MPIISILMSSYKTMMMMTCKSYRSLYANELCQGLALLFMGDEH